MSRLVSAFTVVSSLVGVLTIAPEALADEPFTWSAISFSGGVDYGNGDGVSAFGWGLNGRGGVTLDNGFYLGAVGEYFFGESRKTLTAQEDSSSWQWLAEGGYDFGVLDNLVIRPKLGLGFSAWRYHRELFETARATQTLDDYDPALTVGAQFLTPIKSLQLSGDIRYNTYGGVRSADALMIGLSIGARL